MYVVKIGGSLLTNKDGYCAPNREMVRQYASLIAKEWDRLSGNLILIVGGGSYGNAVPIRYNLKDASLPWREQDLSMMTVKMFEWLSLVTEIFREEGVPCYPFQTSGYVITDDKHPLRYFIEPVQHVLETNVLPVFSGDLVFDLSRKFTIFSSDNIPELFVERMRLTRVVMMTDVEGVMRFDQDGHERTLIPTVTKENFREVLLCTGPSRKQDITGGMKNKLEALLRLAERGVEGVITSGSDPEALLPALFDERPAGTFIRPWVNNMRRQKADVDCVFGM
ncbi:isopentenyl phosphate kinase [Tumebacillus lipolyticus]|uniref:Isopentenyl phosphate kinase n=1 Tax=Tumebacillus lipolyticus TaxID=1280370 RepID=A0ABW4ZSQ0_9BACL